MATKNWKKVGTTDIVEFENRQRKNLSLVVSYAGNSGYEVELKRYSKNLGTTRDVLKSFKIKSQAIKFAKSYMRSH